MNSIHAPIRDLYGVGYLIVLAGMGVLRGTMVPRTRQGDARLRKVQSAKAILRGPVRETVEALRWHSTIPTQRDIGTA